MESSNRSIRRRVGGKRIFGAASGIVATSAWVGSLAEDAMRDLGIKSPPPVGVFDLGTDPDFFNPSRDTGRLRSLWGAGKDPLIVTVARLVPHKGQDVVIKAVASLSAEFPALRYAIVGVGPDEQRLRELAASLGIAERAIFAGALSDDEVAEAYATSTIYAGLSRVEEGIHAEGFGISFLEAAASGIPSVAGDSGGVPTRLRSHVLAVCLDDQSKTDVGSGGWQITLVPRERALLDAVSRVVLRGTGNELAAVEIVEASGDLTLMQISSLPNASVKK